MKINTDDRIAESVALQKAENPVSFEEQVAAAKASGKRWGKSMNVQTGERAVYYYKDNEVTDFTAQTVTRKKSWRRELDDLRAELAALKK